MIDATYGFELSLMTANHWISIAEFAVSASRARRLDGAWFSKDANERCGSIR
jgi:hypothetical protein